MPGPQHDAAASSPLPRVNFPDYPFTPKRFEVRPGIVMSYLDEGPRDAEVLLMLHGNPSWSFYWRHLVAGLSDRYRCIVPDHVGMGLSDKPDDASYDYTLASRVADIDTLVSHLDLGDQLSLAVHDWGGMIGFGWALSNSHRIKRLVVTNTASFPLPTAKAMPWQLKLGRDSKLGALLIRGFNAFAWGAARYGVVERVAPAVQRAYCAPYDSWANRVATLRFVQDIPLSPKDRAWALVEAAGRKLPEYADRPVFLGWGLQDFVFDRHFLEGFTRALPQAEVMAFADAGHYVLEDKHAELVPAIRRFLDQNPLAA